ncbi:MAG: hypothetical protein HQ567_01910, partial [Candidatus Nealsonbacteria bacterium]|nr:hypothetical protein [Candidatus Nealsonbacteria bacterium]
MRNICAILAVVVMLACGGTAPAVDFFDDFESYAPGSDLHGVNIWAGWDNTPGAGAPVSNLFASSPSNSVEIGGGSDLVGSFSDATSGIWEFTTQVYVPSGGSGVNYFIMMSEYNHGGDKTWAHELPFNYATGQIEPSGTGGGGNIVPITFDAWTELKYIVDLDQKVFDAEYGGATISDGNPWSGDAVAAIDLYANSATPIYYDDVSLMSLPTLTWDNVQSANWNSTHWTGGPPSVPDGDTYAILNTANTHTVTVAADAVARNLSVQGGGIAVNAGRTLSIAMRASFAADTTLTVAGTGQLSVGATPSGGNSPLEVTPDGILEVTAGGPVPNSVELAGGTFRFADTMGTPGAAPGGAVAHWAFDETTGSIAANTAPGHLFEHDGDLTNFPFDDSQWVAGKINGALAFDGTDDEVQIFDYQGVSGSAARTMTAWVKTTDGEGPIMSWGTNTAGNKWVFRTQTNNGMAGAIRVEVNGGYIVGNTDVRDNQWHHVAAVLPDGATNVTQMELYVDGALETVSASQDEPVNTDPFGEVVKIGSDSVLNNRYFAGAIDDAYIYDSALTAAQIETMAGPRILPNMATVGLLVTAGSTLESGTEADTDFGVLTLKEGILTTSGQGTINFTSTTIDAGATRVGVGLETPTDLGNALTGRAGLTFAVGGTGTTRLVETYTAGASNEIAFTAGSMTGGTIEVAEGTLRTSGNDLFGGATALKLSGGSYTFGDEIGAPAGGPAEGLLGYWKLDETTGLTAADETGNHDGTLIAFAGDDSQWVPGIQGGSLHFDGADDWMDAGMPATAPTNYTVAMWARADGLTQASVWDSVFSSAPDAGGFQLDVGAVTNGSYQFKGDTTVVAGPVLDDWVHVAFTYDGATVRAYYNGALSNEAATSGKVFSHFRLAINRGGDRRYAGTLDEVYVYDRALSLGEIRGMFGESTPADLSDIHVTVDAPSTLRSESITETAFADLTIAAGTLTTDGSSGIRFADGTTVAAGAVDPGFETLVTTTTGPLTANGNTITKTGGSDLILDEATNSVAGAIFDVQAGRLLAFGEDGASPLTGAAVNLGGGSLALSAKASVTGGSVDFDNAVEATGGTIVAERGGVGHAGPMTVNLGSATNGVSLAGGLELKTEAGYELNVLGTISGDGGLTVNEGTVTLAAADSSIGSMRVTGGTVSTGGNSLEIGQRLKLGNTRFEITGGSFLLAGTDLANENVGHTIALGDADSVIEIGSGGSMADGLLYHLDAAESVTMDGSDMVSAWGDQGDAGNDFSQTDPSVQPLWVSSAIGGLPAIRFAGGSSNQELLLNTPTEPQTFFAVTAATQGGGLRGIWGSENGDKGVRLQDNNWYRSDGHNSDGNDFANGDPNGVRVNGAITGAYTVGEPHIINELRGPNFNATTFNVTSIGEYFANNRDYGGDVAELMAFDRILTDDELNDVGGYLADKYGITAPDYTGGLTSPATESPNTNLVVNANATVTSSSEEVTLGDLTVAAGVSTLVLENAVYTLNNVTFADGVTLNGEMTVRGTLDVGDAIGTITIAEGEIVIDSGAAHNAEVSMSSGAALTAADVDRINVSATGGIYVGGTLAPKGVGRTNSNFFSPVTTLTTIDVIDGAGVFEGGGTAPDGGQAFAAVDPAPAADVTGHIGQGAFLRAVNYERGFGTTITDSVDLEVFVALGGDADGDGKVWLSDWAALRANFG